MKNLILLRHAKAEPEGKVGDHERRLTDRGERDASRVGGFLREIGIRPDAILSSTAMRTRRTTELVIQAAKFGVVPEFLSDLYLAPSSMSLDLLRRLPESTGGVLVIAHNPGLEDLLSELTGQYAPLSTAAFAHIELSIDEWPSLVADQTSRLVQLVRPGEAIAK